MAEQRVCRQPLCESLERQNREPKWLEMSHATKRRALALSVVYSRYHAQSAIAENSNANEGEAAMSDSSVNIDPVAESVQLVMGGADLLPRAEPLWYLLRDYHKVLCLEWVTAVGNKTYADRVREMTAKSDLGMLVVLATSGGEDIGYAIFTATSGLSGELESMYICEPFRGSGLGTSIAQTGLAWLRQGGVKTIGVNTHFNNPAAVRFYERLGFKPRTIRLEIYG